MMASDTALQSDETAIILVNTTDAGRAGLKEDGPEPLVAGSGEDSHTQPGRAHGMLGMLHMRDTCGKKFLLQFLPVRETEATEDPCMIAVQREDSTGGEMVVLSEADPIPDISSGAED